MALILQPNIDEGLWGEHKKKMKKKVCMNFPCTYLLSANAYLAYVGKRKAKSAGHSHCFDRLSSFLQVFKKHCAGDEVMDITDT